MRLIKTFILRLYIDPELGEQVRGDLRALPGKKTLPFKNNADLLGLLYSQVAEEVSGLPAPASQGEQDPDAH